jgi:hypothetical protein
MSFKRDWNHPVTQESGYKLFLAAIDRADKRLDLTATTLGVSTRTAQRWLQKKRVPHRVAVMLDQLENGRAIQGGLWRDRGGLVRHDWKPYFKTRFKDYR